MSQINSSPGTPARGRFLILLSATINPKGMTFLALHNIEERRRQYLAALKALLTDPSPDIGGIVWVENSGADLTAIRELVADQNKFNRPIDIISLDLNDYPRDLGKGYGEFRALDQGLAKSPLSDKFSHIVKMTGRLSVANLGSILRHFPATFDICADIRPESADASKGFMDTRLMAVSRDFYFEKALGLYHEMNDANAVYAETAFYNLARKSAGDAVIYPRLPREPRWIGHAGTDGTPYDDLSQRLKRPYKIVRRAIQRLRGKPNLKRVWAAAPSGKTT